MIGVDIILYIWIVGLFLIPIAYITAEIHNDEEEDDI